MRKFTTRQLTLDAMLAAMCAVLGYLAIDTGTVKVTFESVPVLIAALLFGPLDGMAVGLVGTLVYQLLPYVLCGLIVGLYAKKKPFPLKQGQIVFIIVVAELVITALNTLTLYVDSKIYGYYFPGIIQGALALRLILCVVKAVAYAYLLPLLLRPLRKFIRRKAA